MEDLNLIPKRGDQEKHGDDNEKPATEKYEEMTTGFVKHLLHCLVSPEEIQKNEEEQEEVEQGKGSGSGVSEEEAMKNGGDGEREEVSGIRNGDSVNGGGKGGKIISGFIFNIFHQGEDDGKEGNKEEHRAEAEEIKVNENGGTGVGDIINNLVSHLPASLPDDAAPTTDEATILIHSIVHD